jgi:hypothetical protein
MQGEDAPLLPDNAISRSRASRVLDFVFCGLWGSEIYGLQLIDGSDVELSPTRLLRRDALSVQRFRRFRRGEFLEARIIPKRIEHRIEAEQGRSKRHAKRECA